MVSRSPAYNAHAVKHTYCSVQHAALCRAGRRKPAWLQAMCHDPTGLLPLPSPVVLAHDGSTAVSELEMAHWLFFAMQHTKCYCKGFPSSKTVPSSRASPQDPGLHRLITD